MTAAEFGGFDTDGNGFLSMEELFIVEQAQTQNSKGWEWWWVAVPSIICAFGVGGIWYAYNRKNTTSLNSYVF
jgi:hypothetical protein